MTTSSALFDPAQVDLLAGVHGEGGPKSLFIDGEWKAARNGETRTIVCPADGSVVAEVSEASEGRHRRRHQGSAPHLR